MSRRVVLDTSTLVSAALRIGSVPYQAVFDALATCDICASFFFIQFHRRSWSR